MIKTVNILFVVLATFLHLHIDFWPNGVAEYFVVKYLLPIW